MEKKTKAERFLFIISNKSKATFVRPNVNLYLGSNSGTVLSSLFIVFFGGDTFFEDEIFAIEAKIAHPSFRVKTKLQNRTKICTFS